VFGRRDAMKDKELQYADWIRRQLEHYGKEDDDPIVVIADNWMLWRMQTSLKRAKQGEYDL